MYFHFQYFEISIGVTQCVCNSRIFVDEFMFKNAHSTEPRTMATQEARHKVDIW